MAGASPWAIERSMGEALNRVWLHLDESETLDRMLDVGARG